MGVCGFEGANRGCAVYIELAAVLGAVGLERDEHQIVAALVADRSEPRPEGAHALRVVLAPLGVDWKLKDVLEATRAGMQGLVWQVVADGEQQLSGELFEGGGHLFLLHALQSSSAQSDGGARNEQHRLDKSK